MIRSLSDINREFRAEMADASSPLPDAPQDAYPSQDAQEADGNDDVTDLVSSLNKTAKEKRRPKLLRYTILIAIVFVAVFLIIMASILVNALMSPDVSSNPTGQMQDGLGDGVDSESDGRDPVAPGLEEDEYNSALENLENEVNSMRESQEEGGGTDTSDVSSDAESRSETDASYVGFAALYKDLITPEHISEAIPLMTEGNDSAREWLIERINARFLADADRNAPSLPSGEEINSDAEFTNLTVPANALVDSINAGLTAGSRLPEVIDLRTKALEIYPLRILKKLLATDYEDLGCYYAVVGHPAADAFDAFINSIEYRTDYLSELSPESGVYYAEIGRIGRTFTNIAEIGGADAGLRRHAGMIAACLFEMAAR
jgi:hypothetical protein